MAKRSRRARRQAREQQVESSTRSTPDQSSSPAPVSSAPPEPVADYGPVSSRGADLVQEYFYVYVDLRNILIVAILMTAVLVGLSFVI